MKISRFTVFILGAFAASASPAGAAPVSYEAPEESAKLRPGPGMQAAEAYCGICHSYDYINTQPRGDRFGRGFWQAEVNKMIKAYGAPIPEADAKTIADYLAAAYAK